MRTLKLALLLGAITFTACNEASKPAAPIDYSGYKEYDFPSLNLSVKVPGQFGNYFLDARFKDSLIENPDIMEGREKGALLRMLSMNEKGTYQLLQDTGNQFTSIAFMKTDYVPVSVEMTKMLGLVLKQQLRNQNAFYGTNARVTGARIKRSGNLSYARIMVDMETHKLQVFALTKGYNTWAMYVTTTDTVDVVPILHSIDFSQKK